MDENLKKIQKLLDAAEGNLTTARNLMRQLLDNKAGKPIDVGGIAKDLNVIDDGKIVEGVFNGESMIGADGKEYPVPANYASKSKLVEGDTLKLTIADDGSFVYKQIAPIERRKTMGTLAYTTGSYVVEAEGKDYRVLPASVTYFKGQPGDQVTIIIPKDHESAWGAVENIIKKSAIEETVESAPAEKDKPAKEEAPEDNGPQIEYPAEETKAEEPEEKPKSKKSSKEESKNDQSTDEGIKELEI